MHLNSTVYHTFRPIFSFSEMFSAVCLCIGPAKEAGREFWNSWSESPYRRAIRNVQRFSLDSDPTQPETSESKKAVDPSARTARE